MKKINSILKIGNNEYENIYAILAPMAGFTDLPFRIVCEEYGCNFTFTEMINAKALCYHDEKTTKMLDVSGQKKYVGVQIFGSDVKYMGEAVKIINELGRFSHIDINMGCPAPKIVKNGDGSALMKNPTLASKIVQEAKKNSDIPVTVKIRRGRRQDEEVAPEFARAMEAAGASAVAIHGRFATQMYRGQAEWETVNRVCDAVSIPVIGSGDMLTAEAAAHALTETGVTAVMIARGTYGNPWIFKNTQALVEGQPVLVPTLDQMLASFMMHVRLLDAAHIHIARARSLSTWYFRGIPNAAYWRGKSVRCVTAQDFIDLALEIKETVKQLEGEQESPEFDPSMR